MIVQKFLPRLKCRIETRFSAPTASEDAFSTLPINLREAH
jgi:hypothetical protein